MPKDNMKMGELFIRDVETGEVFRFDGVKNVTEDTYTHTLDPIAELEESPIDGISILITGSQLDRVDSIDIHIEMKEGD